MENKNDIGIFQAAKTARLGFEHAYTKAKEAYDSDTREARENYRGQMLAKKQQEAESAFRESLEAARDEIMEDFSKMVERKRMVETAHVSHVDNLIINELKALEGLPLSAAEITALSKSRRFSGYWEQKWISKLAAENGCDISAFSPDYGTRMGVLDEVEAAINQYCEKFDGIGDTPYMVLALASDEHLLELERRFTENYSTEQLNREQVAERIITSALSQQSVMGRGIFLRNSLENADGKLKQELFYQLSQSPGKMPPDILRIANVYSHFNEFCENEAGGMKTARDLFDRVVGERNETDAAAILQNASESGEINQYFMEELPERAKHSAMLAHACKNSGVEELKDAVSGIQLTEY